MVSATGISSRSPALEPAGPVLQEEPSAPRVVVAYSLAKGERTEWAAAKLTELGVDVIVPLVCDRTVVRPDPSDDGGRRPARLERVVREAGMLARRVHLPTLSPPRSFDEMLGEGVAPAGGVAVADPSGEPLSLETPVILVGPEGGWSEREWRLAGTRGVTSVVLGAHVLRVETAAVAAGTLLTALRSDLVAPLPVESNDHSPKRRVTREHPA